MFILVGSKQFSNAFAKNKNLCISQWFFERCNFKDCVSPKVLFVDKKEKGSLDTSSLKLYQDCFVLARFICWRVFIIIWHVFRFVSLVIQAYWVSDILNVFRIYQVYPKFTLLLNERFYTMDILYFGV